MLAIHFCKIIILLIKKELPACDSALVPTKFFICIEYLLAAQAPMNFFVFFLLLLRLDHLSINPSSHYLIKGNISWASFLIVGSFLLLSLQLQGTHRPIVACIWLDSSCKFGNKMKIFYSTS